MIKPIMEAEGARAALERLPDIAAQENLEAPPLARVYVPKGHQRALSLDASVVVGMRGAGKSLWTAVLSSDTHRRFVATLANSPGLADLKVRVAFGLDQSNEHFPNASVLAQAVQSGVEPAVIWKTVVLRHGLSVMGRQRPFKDWVSAAQWVASHPEEADNDLTECDRFLHENRQVMLVLFDSLDQLGADWPAVRSLTSGALRFALHCRTRRAIRLKFFLRPDMEEDLEIWKFPDSSKLRQFKVALDWKPVDLYSLVLTSMANDATFGKSFRASSSKAISATWKSHEGVFLIPHELTKGGAPLRQVMESIAGEWMGLSAKRGFTYTWIPTHLADAADRISPRTFLLAFKKAAQVTDERHAGYSLPLHYEGIQQGVAAASETRIDEIKEDYPWVAPLLEAARDLSVPCEPNELTARWKPKEIRAVSTAGEQKLPPRRFTTDLTRSGRPEALIDDLVELAVLYRTEDGRLNMPDIFRVGFGIKRKGGVKPLR